jgi:putative endopeptidase
MMPAKRTGKLARSIGCIVRRRVSATSARHRARDPRASFNSLGHEPVNRSFLRRVIPSACALAFAQLVFAQQAAPLTTGIDRTTGDPSVRIQDDAFRSVEGKWLAETPIPADKSSIGGFDKLYEETQPQLRELIENSSHVANVPASAADAKKIGDLYASFMDEAKIEGLGLKPVSSQLTQIEALKTKGDLVAAFATYGRLGVNVPFAGQVHQDAKDSTKYIVDLGQAGIGLPDRDYFLSKTDKRFADVRVKYEAYLTKLLTMAGDKNAAAEAKAVFALETKIAEVQWTRVENRDPVKTYNVVTVADLSKLAPHLDWKAFMTAGEIQGKVDSLVISQPTYVKGLDQLIATVPMSTWKAYLKAHFLNAYAPFLNKDLVDTRFAFVGTVLSGQPEDRPRWKRGVRLVEQSIGEGLGRLYVAKYFPPESKSRMDQLVKNLLAAYKVSIDGLDWMGAETKKQAQIKLATFMPKIGYPVHWRDYSTLAIDRNDLVGNVINAKTFEYHRNIAKLGKPIDRDEWGMTPQTINAYYNSELNEIVFPAAILQPPFFNAKADDAANYGAIGAVIGHEISHGFDDEGSQYDEKGNLRNWWTEEDRKRFGEKTKSLIAQYSAYAPVAGYNVNGALTLGENIADNSGLAIAYKAYRISLNGKEAPVIDGLTGDQRFYMGFAQAWQEKNREAAIIAQVKSDPHSPGEFRANGTLTNQPAFYEAFGVKPGDKMYTAPEKRVIIW